MTDTPTLVSKAESGIRIVLAVGGTIALLFGVLIIAWPTKTAGAIALLIAIYALLSGIVYVLIGIFSRLLSGWARIGHIVLGAVFVVASIFAFGDLQSAARVLAIFVSVFIGISWLIEGIVSLSTLRLAVSKGWTIFFAIVSIVAGIAVLFAPLFAAQVLWLWLGILLVIIGIAQLVRAITFKVVVDA